MVEPIALATLITTCVVSGLSLLVNLWQSIKEGHFKLNCSDCCTLEGDVANKDH